jgi:hypothetical protein
MLSQQYCQALIERMYYEDKKEKKLWMEIDGDDDDDEEFLFENSIKDIEAFYSTFVNTNNDYEQDITYKKAKIYLRLFTDTGHWYIGYTTQEFAFMRHEQDIETYTIRKRNAKHKLANFYRDHCNDPFMIFTIASMNNLKDAKTLEKRLIRYFTNPQTISQLPINLCLNTEHVFHIDT